MNSARTLKHPNMFQKHIQAQKTRFKGHEPHNEYAFNATKCMIWCYSMMDWSYDDPCVVTLLWHSYCDILCDNSYLDDNGIWYNDVCHARMCEVRDPWTLFSVLEYIFGTYSGVLVFGHYSPNTIHRTLFIGTIHWRVARCHDPETGPQHGRRKVNVNQFGRLF